ncbi:MULTISPECIES: hypothetical protein [Coriobacteriales]|nr:MULTISPECIES: hypothetical protein [Atopobiaceae]MBF0600022.1 hypothetical protein [Atopobiaceae bacterium FL090493]
MAGRPPAIMGTRSHHPKEVPMRRVIVGIAAACAVGFLATRVVKAVLA